MMNGDYYLALAAARVRGEFGVGGSDAELLAFGRDRGLDLHTFKRSRVMPRVRAALSAVKGVGAVSIADIGTGRGAFLWPLLEEVPGVTVTSVEPDEARIAPIAAVARGLAASGDERLSAMRGDACDLGLREASFDAVTILEVLEHLRDPAPAARECLRVARTAVVASVPSREDENPEHVRVFSPEALSSLFRAAGACRVKVSEVQGSLVCVAWR